MAGHLQKHYQGYRSSFFLPFLLLSLFFFTACEPDEVFINDDSLEAEIENTNAPAAFQNMLMEINALRAEGCRCGDETMPPVSGVQWNGKVAAAAAQHSEDMARIGQLNHTGSDGSSAGDRLHDAGYLWRAYGENIASGYTSASAVLQGWISSPGHCRNLMQANFTEIGVARKDNYWTQVFARPR